MLYSFYDDTGVDGMLNKFILVYKDGLNKESILAFKGMVKNTIKENIETNN